MIVIEPHYLGSLEYFTLLRNHKEVTLEVSDTFKKQTFRNRAYFLTANKIQPLSIPVIYSSNTKTRDVKVDHSQGWIKNHWGAFYSGYGKAPFFEYFAEDFKAIWDKAFTFLVDYNMNFLQLTIKILQLDIDVNLTDDYKDSYEHDYRNVIGPKKPFSDRKIYRPCTYPQLFGNTFVPNLSIVDLIMCEGPNSAQILSNSLLEMD